MLRFSSEIPSATMDLPSRAQGIRLRHLVFSNRLFPAGQKGTFCSFVPLEERGFLISQKIDAVAANVKAHREDTEAHPKIYQVKE